MGRLMSSVQEQHVMGMYYGGHDTSSASSSMSLTTMMDHHPLMPLPMLEQSLNSSGGLYFNPQSCMGGANQCGKNDENENLIFDNSMGGCGEGQLCIPPLEAEKTTEEETDNRNSSIVENMGSGQIGNYWEGDHELRTVVGEWDLEEFLMKDVSSFPFPADFQKNNW